MAVEVPGLKGSRKEVMAWDHAESLCDDIAERAAQCSKGPKPFGDVSTIGRIPKTVAVVDVVRGCVFVPSFSDPK